MAPFISPNEPNVSHHATAPQQQRTKPPLTPFPAANNDYRYLRKRASILCAAFNAQPIDVIVNPADQSDDIDPPPCPMIKGPIHIDYGINVHIHPSCFINRDCYIADTPEGIVSIGENTLVGVGARLLGVTHSVDWRERKGRLGVSLAGDVRIGKDCFLGAGVMILPGVDVGDGCVIGAGSVVTRDVPAYHAAAGVPARVIRKVALDAPDAPGLAYEMEGDRLVVRRPESSCALQHGLFLPVVDFKALRQAGTLLCRELIGKAAHVVDNRNVVKHAAVLLVGAALGYWLAM